MTELARLYDLAAADRVDPRPAAPRGGLIESKKTGGRTIYSVPRDRVQQLLDEAGDLLLRFCRNPGAESV